VLVIDSVKNILMKYLIFIVQIDDRHTESVTVL